MEPVIEVPVIAPIVPVVKVLTPAELEKKADERSERITSIQFYLFISCCIAVPVLLAYFKIH